MADEMAALQRQLGAPRWQDGNFEAAIALFRTWSLADTLADFLTLAAYEQIVEPAARA